MKLRLRSSALDKWLIPPSHYEVDKLDDTYIDKAIYKLFTINTIQLINVKAILAKQFHIAPSEVDRMPYWEYEYWMKALNDQVKEENESQQEQMDKYKVGDVMSSISSGKFAKNMTPQTPTMPKMQAPSFGTMKTPF